MADNPYLTLDRQIAGDGYTSSAAMDNLTTLCDTYGSRFGGTPGERAAAEFLRDKLIEYGWQGAHLEAFPYRRWQRGAATLEVLEPVSRTVPCISLPYSPAATVTAQLVDLGDGAPAAYEAHAAEIDGQIVMANSETYPAGMKRWVHRMEKYGRAVLGGATAFIFMNHYPAYGPATGSIGHRGRPGAIPGISVAYEDGAWLQRLVKRHGSVTVRVTTTDTMAAAESWNVVAELPGLDLDTIVMFGSHYDGHDISQGAQDPASGVAAALEAARLLAKHAGSAAGTSLHSTLRVVFWGVEEIGLLGSHAYADAHAAELDKMRFYFNMDGAGAVKNKGVVLNEWPALAPLFEGWQAQMALDFGIAQSVHAHSDHYPFLLKGVVTGGLESVPKGTGGRGYGHTRYDTLDKVSVRELQDAAVMAARLLLRVADAAEWPATQRTPEEVKALFEGPEHAAENAFREAMAAYYAADEA